ncbi:MAG TPA: hypothetical protein VH307_23920 [Streptosporangiaceae bacterium]|nr:hypothetical protein [Streptosporangiaceae bacterium]
MLSAQSCDEEFYQSTCVVTCIVVRADAYARGQIDAIAQAQKTGDLPAHFHPGFLLGLVLHLATGWVSVSPEFEAAIDVPAPEERARHVENAIRTLLSQPAPADQHLLSGHRQ